MKVTSIKTRKIYPRDDLLSLLISSLPPLQEKQIIAISSKVLSLCYGYFIEKETASISKEELIEKEAEHYWKGPSEKGMLLTIKEGCFLPFSGIDESNSVGTYVLFPEMLFAHTASLWKKLRSYYDVKELGVIIVDSQLIPLRRGTIGISLSWCGLTPLYSYRGKKDCFGYSYKMTDLNLIDAYAIAAVVEMGEGDEQTPFAIIEDAPKAKFIDHPPTEEGQLMKMRFEEDFFYPLLALLGEQQ